MPSVLLPEVVVAGKRLGRNIDHDPASLAYLLPAAEKTVSVEWERHIPILDQDVPVEHGSCTGNAETGALGTDPLWDSLDKLVADGLVLDEDLAISIYSDAEKLDGGAGLPTEDRGSSGLSVAKVAKARGYISGYLHATSLAAAHTAIQTGPFLVGSYWYTSMDSPSAKGVVTIGGKIRGGHEYLCRQYDADADLWWFDNSWGTGFGVDGRFAYDSATLETLLSRSGDITSLVPIDRPSPKPKQTPLAAFLAVAEPWAAEHHSSASNLTMQSATKAYIDAVS